MFSAFLEEHPQDARQIMAKTLLAAKARLAAKAAKDTIIRKGIMEGLTLPGKLADCSSKNPEESEISIRLGRVEAGRPFTLLRPKFRICGKCGIGGHYKTTCPKNYETRGGKGGEEEDDDDDDDDEQPISSDSSPSSQEISIGTPESNPPRVTAKRRFSEIWGDGHDEVVGVDSELPVRTVPFPFPFPFSFPSVSPPSPVEEEGKEEEEEEKKNSIESFGDRSIVPLVMKFFIKWDVLMTREELRMCENIDRKSACTDIVSACLNCLKFFRFVATMDPRSYPTKGCKFVSPSTINSAPILT